jgi:hypothetical protein
LCQTPIISPLSRIIPDFTIKNNIYICIYAVYTY